MKQFLLRFVPVFAWFCAGVVLADGPVRVTAERVNLRAAPRQDAEVVGQVQEGAVLQAEGREGDWVCVQPLEENDFWIYGELVEDGVVRVSKALVRCGPGINYTVVGKLGPGDLVKVRGTSAEWLRIAPPKGLALWVSASYVEEISAVTAGSGGNVDQKDSTEAVVAPVPAVALPVPVASVLPKAESVAQPQPVPPSSSADPVAVQGRPGVDPAAKDETAGLGHLVDRPDQGASVELEGRVRRAGFMLRRPSKYELVKSDVQGRTLVLCYLGGDEQVLAAGDGQSFRVNGRQYWLQGIRFPLVLPDRLTPVSAH